MDPSAVPQIDELTKKFYEPASSQDHHEAATQLNPLISSPEALPQLIYLIDASSSPHTRYFVSSALNDLLKKHSENLTSQAKADLHSRLFNFLTSNVSTLPAFVTSGFARCLARVDKVAWMEIDSVRGVVEDCATIHNQSSEQAYVSLLILKELVQEINTPPSGSQLSLHRRRSQKFKQHLPLIFKLGLDFIYNFVASPNQDGVTLMILNESLDLVNAVLSFDFIGTCAVADTSEEIATVHVPKDFREFFEDKRIVSAFFAVQKFVPAGAASRAFNCILRIASVSRSVFASKDDRKDFLRLLMEESFVLLTSGVSPHQFVQSSPQLLHDLARLFVRIKSNFEFIELQQCPIFKDWLLKIGEFSIQTFEVMHTGEVTNAVYYFLLFWDRLVSSFPYTQQGNNVKDQLNGLASKIFASYVKARIDMTSSGVDDDEFDSTGGHLVSLSTVARSQYEETSKVLFQAWNSMVNSGKPLAIAWLVRLIGSLLSSRVTSAVKDTEQDGIDIEIAGLVLKFVSGESTQSAKLDYSLVLFLRQFCRAFLTEKVLKSPYYSEKLCSFLGPPLHENIIKMTLQKIISNLHHHPTEELIIDTSLEVFRELVTGYSSSKMVKECSFVSEILSQHRAPHLTFLSHRADTEARVNYYFIIGRILFDELHISKFSEFVKPFNEAAVQLLPLVKTNPNALLRDPEIRFQVCSLFKDLKGLCNAILEKKFYPLFLSWFHSTFFELFNEAMAIGAKDPDLAYIFVSLAEELSSARSSRCSFKHHTATGTLLFRDVAQVLISFTRNFKEVEVKKDLYDEKLKNLSIATSALANTVSGGYVNFGVCELYGDFSLNQLTIILMEHLIEINPKVISQYPSASRFIVVFVDSVAQFYPQLLVSLGDNNLKYIEFVITFLTEACQSLDSFVVSNSCSAIDSLAAYLFSGPSVLDQNAIKLKQLMTQPSIFPIVKQLLDFILKSVLFDDVQNQWSLTRPLLPLILVFPDIYSAAQQEAMVMVKPESQGEAMSLFASLSDNVKTNIEATNRDVFSQNLTRLRTQLKSLLKV
ncbi:hypothetical protein P9112_004179 [Eukaryota sp. TZLM1-RC]